MKRTETKADYLKLFEGVGAAATSKQREALEYAHAIRQFEIKSYWQCATYFSVLIAAALAGYLLMLQTGEERTLASRFLVTCLGFVLSLAWYVVSRGNKYWQENWERHIDLLEDEISGPLQKTSVDRPYALRHLLAPYPFAVTTVSQILSLFMTFIWALLAMQNARNAWAVRSYWMTAMVVAASAVASLALLRRGTRKTGDADFEGRMETR